LYSVIKNYTEPFYHSNILNFYFEDLKIGVIDIETTGLSPDRSRFILGGLVVPKFGEKKLLQFFAETKEQESEILEAYQAELNQIDILINYNGDGFDLPFLSRRLQRQGMSCISHGDGSFPLQQSFDLYRVIDRYSSLRKLLPNLKQKTVETFLGLWTDRADEISGAESVELYHNFLSTRDPKLREIILLHNSDDLLQLSRLMKILEKVDLHRIMFHNGFLVSHERKKALIRGITLRKDSVTITGIHNIISMDYRSYLPGYEAEFLTYDHSFTIKIPWKMKKGFFYIDLDDFSMDSSIFEKYPACQSGFLLLKDDTEIHYAEINHLVKLILKEILASL